MTLVNPAVQSYSGRTFDRCPACSDVALDAIIQSALYVIPHVAGTALGRPDEDLTIAFRVRARLSDEAGADIAVDQMEIRQTISGAGDASIDADETTEDDGAAGGTDAGAAHAELGDFQAMIDRVQIAPAGDDSLTGIITGRLFGFERLIGPFEVLVGPC